MKISLNPESLYLHIHTTYIQQREFSSGRSAFSLWAPMYCTIQYLQICYVQYIGMRDGKHLFVRNESLFTSEPWLCVTTAHELRRIWKLGGKGRGFYTWAWCVSNRSWALGNKYVAVTQCWRGPTSIRILNHIWSHPGLFFFPHMYPNVRYLAHMRGTYSLTYAFS